MTQVSGFTVKFQIQNLIVKFMCFLVLFTAVMASVSGIAIAAGKPDLLFFTSKDCDECKNVKEEFLPGFLEKFGNVFTFVELDVTDSLNVANLDSLYALEDRVGVKEEDKGYPAVYFLGTMVEGEIPVTLRLESVIKAYMANPDSMWAIHREVMARAPEKIVTSKNTGGKTVHIAYFYKQGCKKCGRALEIIGWLEKNYRNIVVEKFDIADQNNKILAVALGLRAGVPENELMSTPSFFIGARYLLSSSITRKDLSGLVDRYTKTGAEAVWKQFDDAELKNAERKIQSRFQSFSIFVIIMTGLVDGINPCAFATIVFFISYLTMIRRKGKEILMVGFAFAFAVFITYFFVGLGFFNIIKSVVNIGIVSKIIFGGTAVLCIIFGFLSIGDYFKARSGNTGEMSLQLPLFLKKRIHATIREKARMRSFVIGALIAGFMVSIFEFACTGQVYLPTIIFMLQRSDSRAVASLYLLLYNLFFIVPLLIVFGVVYMGVSSNTVGRFMEARVGMVKLVLAVVFFGVAALLLWSVL